MIRINNLDIYLVSLGQRSIGAIYKGARLVWQAISSCFAGTWLKDETWKNDETWHND